MMPWWNDFLSDKVNVLANKDIAFLVQKALASHEGQLSDCGALVIKTGRFTGRAAEDKYVVEDDYSKERIDWENVKSLSQRNFDNIKNEFVRNYNKEERTLYVMERSVGADPRFNLGVRLITPNASHALFAHHMFRESMTPSLGTFTIFHIPELNLDPKGLGLRGPTVIAINFSNNEILIGGTGYAGEIKKSVFSVMNTLLPDHGVLPMHSGSNIDEEGKVSIFFGLSGTGKTTLSTDLGKKLIGDDEHGLTPEGIFNIEGGCYAKTFKLTEKGEPQVYHATNRFGALMENVMLDEESRPLFDDDSITENGRSSYPLEFVSDANATGRGPFPKNIFFLSADAMGVLPVIAKLNSEQAMYFFLSGYTAKLAGTELGLAGIKATFSHCFGAPFMMRHPMDYAELLKKYLDSSDVKVWLVNTGWYGGVYGEGRRFDLNVTRNLIRSVQSNGLIDQDFEVEEVFGLAVPKKVDGVEAKYLNAKILWKDQRQYLNTANKLKHEFEENYKKFLRPGEKGESFPDSGVAL